MCCFVSWDAMTAVILSGANILCYFILQQFNAVNNPDLITSGGGGASGNTYIVTIIACVIAIVGMIGGSLLCAFLSTQVTGCLIKNLSGLTCVMGMNYVLNVPGRKLVNTLVEQQEKVGKSITEERRKMIIDQVRRF